MIFSAVVILMCCGEFRDSIGLGISWAQVFLRNCILLGSSSLSWDGVFVNNPTSGMANASLWTIQKEFQCYLLVAALGGFGLLRFRWLILLFSFLALLIHARASLAGSNTTFSDSRLTTYFLFGVSTWLWRDKIPYSKWLGVLSLLVLLAASKQPPWFSILFVFAGGYLTFFSGYGPFGGRKERIFPMLFTFMDGPSNKSSQRIRI
jgi:peptidoglycan/LPS O-acetylase OafA/YrhL